MLKKGVGVVMKKEVYVPLLITLILALALLLLSPSPWINGVFLLFLIVSSLYYFTTYPNNPRPNLRLAQWYFVALAVQCLHFVEEYVGMLYIELPALFELPPIEKDEFVNFNLVAYAIFILGGVAILKNARSFMLIPIFFILLGVLANGIIHVLLAIWTGGYFAGLYTAIIYLFLGPLLLKLLNKVSSKASTDL